MGTRGRPGTIRLRYLVTDEALEVEGVGEFRGEGPEPTLSDLSRQILTALVDEHDVRRGSDGLPCFRFRKARMEYGRR